MLALVLGGASCVWDDIAKFEALGQSPQIVVACNDMIAAWDRPLSAACSLHVEKLRGWLNERAKKGHLPPAKILVSEAAEGFDRTEPFFRDQLASGSSGLFALKVALVDLRADKAICCGVPMNRSPHFFDSVDWREAPRHWHGWLQALPQIRDRARSMSGNTMRLLGPPSHDWLAH